MTDTLVELREKIAAIIRRDRTKTGSILTANDRADAILALPELKAQASRIAELKGVLKELDLIFEFERPGLAIAENRGISFRRMSDAFQAAHKALSHSSETPECEEEEK